jgi:Reverse transcriptase (RNA-dependent DNA polymerase)
MSLETPIAIRTLQRKLYRKAKQEPDFRFYLLYDKIYREDILSHAYELAKANKGAPGVDGQTFEAIESEGLEKWMEGIRKDLRDKTYKPQPVRRVLIPKPGGGERPLGIPTIRDRTVQTAAKLVLEPIFEADLESEAYGYRPKRSAHDAIQKVHKLLCEGYTDVVDADLSKYFDTIPHTQLLKSVARRIVDRNVLHLIKMWLKVPVEERDEKRQAAHEGRTKQPTWISTRRSRQPDARKPVYESLPQALADHGKEQGFPRSSSYVCGRFCDSQPRPCGGSTGLDAQRDDAARPYPERSADQHQDSTQGELSFSGLHVRAASLQAGWSLVSGSQSVKEESATHPAESGRPIDTRKRWRVGRSARPPQPDSARLVGLLLLRLSRHGVPRSQQLRL